MTGMNEQVREAVREALESRNLSQGKLAESLGMERPNLTRLLSGKSGKIPDVWQKVLDALDLELVAIPKKKND